MSLSVVDDIIQIGYDAVEWAKDNIPEDAGSLYGYLVDVATGEEILDVETIVTLSEEADRVQRTLDPQELEDEMGSRGEGNRVWGMAKAIVSIIGTAAVNVEDVDGYFERCNSSSLDGYDSYDECIEAQLESAMRDMERVWGVIYGGSHADSLGYPLSELIDELLGLLPRL